MNFTPGAPKITFFLRDLGPPAPFFSLFLFFSHFWFLAAGRSGVGPLVVVFSVSAGKNTVDCRVFPFFPPFFLVPCPNGLSISFSPPPPVVLKGLVLGFLYFPFGPSFFSRSDSQRLFIFGQKGRSPPPPFLSFFFRHSVSRCWDPPFELFACFWGPHLLFSIFFCAIIMAESLPPWIL